MNKTEPTSRGSKWRRIVAVPLALVAFIGLLPAASPAYPAGPRIDLVVLVVRNEEPAVDALISELEQQGTPHRIVDLADANRPVINADFLAGESDGVRHGHFQAVILASNQLVAVAGLAEAELAALTDYEQEFGVRRVYARVWAGPDVGLEWNQFSDPLDGTVATVTQAGRENSFGYLVGNVPISDWAWGYLSRPLDLMPAGQTFTPLVEIPVPTADPADSWVAPLIGVHTVDRREELVIGMSSNRHQLHLRALAPGIIDWATQGVHLGYSRHYFSVHVDDLFMPDSRWSIEGNCTPWDDCPTDDEGNSLYQNEDIRMTADDVAAVRSWQAANGFVFDFAYNGAGSDEAFAVGHDPLSEALLAHRHDFRWINHTYGHPYLGCVQDFSVSPWQCGTDANGNQWMSQADIVHQIAHNDAWARRRRIPVRSHELVTGEHSGLRSEPQMSGDSPNLAPALSNTGITVVASDASREFEQRRIGSALTLPRHPMNIFYNVATREEEVSEYNWIYTSKANGGSGICESDPNSTCIAPLDLASGFENYIIPIEASIAMSHVVGNNPRPHYAHQSNLAEDRILLPVVAEILARHRGLFSPAAPLINPTMTEAAAILLRQDKWDDQLAAGGVTAYIQDGVVTVSGAGVEIPLTTPEGSRQSGNAFGSAYAGRQSGWLPAGGGTVVVN